ncbi:MAG: NnrS family protein [Acetobacteraceae bacterium]
MQQSRTREVPVFLAMGFRPFFLAAGVWAAVALALWLGILGGWIHLPTRFDPLAWHVHEMLFGFILAGIAGFLLTAIPNWTGRPPISGRWLALLLGIWAIGRIVCLVSALLPAWFAGAADLAFPLTLLGVAAHEIVTARDRRNLPVIGPLLLFVVADSLMQLTAVGVAVPPGLGWRLGIAAVLVLISVIAGRIVPLFTRNWLSRRGERKLPAAWGLLDSVALALLDVALLGWVLRPGLRPLGYFLVLAGVASLWRLARWRGGATGGELLVLILHIAYAWLGLGTAMLGLSLLVRAVPISAAIHALTVGAIATMLLAVMTRATLGHTGRSLTAGPATVAIYLLVTGAAVARIAAAFIPGPGRLLLFAGGILWIGAFLLFSVVYGRMVFGVPARRLDS